MENFADFARQVGALKQVKRAGWERVGIENAESVADHTLRSVLLAMTLPSSIQVNRIKLAQLMAIHDLAESDPEVGDITPHDNVPEEEKFKREQAAMRKLCAAIENGNEIYQLWLEYEENKTEEAKIAHELDKLEMVIQALEYEQRLGIDLTQFFTSSAKNITHPVLLKLFRELLEKRKTPDPTKLSSTANCISLKHEKIIFFGTAAF